MKKPSKEAMEIAHCHRINPHYTDIECAADIDALCAERDRLREALKGLIQGKDTGAFDVSVETGQLADEEADEMELRHMTRVAESSFLWDKAREAIKEAE